MAKDDDKQISRNFNFVCWFPCVASIVIADPVVGPRPPPHPLLSHNLFCWVSAEFTTGLPVRYIYKRFIRYSCIIFIVTSIYISSPLLFPLMYHLHSYFHCCIISIVYFNFCHCYAIGLLQHISFVAAFPLFVIAAVVSSPLLFVVPLSVPFTLLFYSHFCFHHCMSFTLLNNSYLYWLLSSIFFLFRFGCISFLSKLTSIVLPHYCL